MEPEFRSLVDDALTDIPADGRFEWMSQLPSRSRWLTATRILGLPDALAPVLKKQGYAMVERISGLVSEDRISQLDEEELPGLTAVIEAYTRARIPQPARTR